ncbi:hypothetical protein SRHO_G00061670 [Serrasalmus rhombeus]
MYREKMRFLMFLLVVIVLVGFNALHCRDITDSQLTDMDTPLKSRVARSGDTMPSKMKVICSCNEKLHADGRNKCRKKGICSCAKCRKALYAKISTPI